MQRGYYILPWALHLDETSPRYPNAGGDLLLILTIAYDKSYGHSVRALSRKRTTWFFHRNPDYPPFRSIPCPRFFKAPPTPADNKETTWCLLHCKWMYMHGYETWAVAGYGVYQCLWTDTTLLPGQFIMDSLRWVIMKVIMVYMYRQRVPREEEFRDFIKNQDGCQKPFSRWGRYWTEASSIIAVRLRATIVKNHEYEL